ncbi:uncharacterized protein LOC115686983 isoform X1 [Syzygium oleosum]|uniref:uncharacterized protein LOC115686983 isoform X1 n=1 Tax=Syzygium oleosum TaxID=219896 RepID=UPI0011D22B43|nr:uncharacterized protein LOC115686983 isoform X1 [Syzygium oleosum]
MSSENGDPCLSGQPIESTNETKMTKISYSREFLLSLSGLDICRNLPRGFDESILAEFEDASQDRQRTSGSFLLQGYRRNEYGSSPPTRGDVSNYSRGIHGRWDSRSSGWSDKDSDSQSDWDSDTGKRYANPSRRGWQAPEHDGLLGSGGFPRPSGYTPGVSAAKFRPNDQYQLNRTTEPYHPPRPYKALPHSRRETNDSFNNETFGSSDCTSEDRAEEERKRRASFELMRKEHHKAFQERQKNTSEKHKDPFDISTLMDDSTDQNKQLNSSNEFNELKEPKVSTIESAKLSLGSQIAGPRPLVPPGFATTVQDRKSHSAEVKTLAPDGSIFHARDNIVLNGLYDGQRDKETADQISLITRLHVTPELQSSEMDKSEVITSPALDISNQTLKGKKLLGTCNLSETSESSDIGQSIDLDSQEAERNKMMSQSDHPTTILEKLFGSALSLESAVSSSHTEQQGTKGDDVWSSHSSLSSKFAHLFGEEEKKTADDTLSGRPKDLLSLIGVGDKGESSVSDVQTPEQPWSKSLFSGSQPKDKQMTEGTASAAVGSCEQFANRKPGGVPAVLTCEDLENTILSEISDSGSNLQQPLQAEAKVEQPRANVDSLASQHLLSLLHKGTNNNDVALFPSFDVKFADQVDTIEGERTSNLPGDSKETTSHSLPNHGNSLTLETLFGTAFMKELQSIGAPVSAQRSSTGSARVELFDPHGSSHPVIGGSMLASVESEAISSRNIHESNGLTSDRSHQSNMDITEDRFLKFDHLRTEVDTLQLQPEVGPKLSNFGGPAEIRLPEEDSLITVSDPLNLQGLMPGRHPDKAELSSSNAPFDVAENFAAHGIFKEEKYAREQVPSHFHQIPFSRREPDIPFPNVHAQQSSPQLHPHRLNHVGPMFNSLDSHTVHSNTPMKIADGILHHDQPLNYQFPANMVRPQMHHLSSGFPGFDPPSHHPMLQQMHLPPSFPPPHQLQGFPGGPQVNHLNNQVSGLIQELNPLQGFPFGQRQPNSGLPPPAPEAGIGNNHPEAFQRLLDLERRANAKQMNPFAAAAAGHSQGMYGGRDIDMGFRYR